MPPNKVEYMHINALWEKARRVYMKWEYKIELISYLKDFKQMKNSPSSKKIS